MGALLGNTHVNFICSCNLFQPFLKLSRSKGLDKVEITNHNIQETKTIITHNNHNRMTSIAQQTAKQTPRGWKFQQSDDIYKQIDLLTYLILVRDMFSSSKHAVGMCHIHLMIDCMMRTTACKNFTGTPATYEFHSVLSDSLFDDLYMCIVHNESKLLFITSTVCIFRSTNESYLGFFSSWSASVQYLVFGKEKLLPDTIVWYICSNIFFDFYCLISMQNLARNFIIKNKMVLGSSVTLKGP